MDESTKYQSKVDTAESAPPLLRISELGKNESSTSVSADSTDLSSSESANTALDVEQDIKKDTSFTKRVAFDTFDNKAASDLALTLRAKHKDYRLSRLSRTFLCGVDYSKYTESAIEWLLEDLAEDGDELVFLHAIDPNSKRTDYVLEEKQYREEAHKLLKWIIDRNTQHKKISVILEFTIGKVEDMIQRVIQIYEPALLVVGTRGKSLDGFKGLLPGSVSKYSLQHSPIPVIVVRPWQKRQKKKSKREKDPTRQSYRSLLIHDKKATSIKYYPEGSTREHVLPKIPNVFIDIR